MPFILAVDFDGTIFEGSYPKNGSPKRDIIDRVKAFKKNGAEICLWTCRGGKALKEAIEKSKEVGLAFDAVNDNAPSSVKYIEEKGKEGEIMAHRKILADFYLDDKAYNLDFFLKIDVKATCERFAER